MNLLKYEEKSPINEKKFVKKTLFLGPYSGVTH